MGHPECRTTHSRNRRPLGSSLACFSTPRMRLAFSRRHNQPSQRLRRCPGLRKTSVGKPCAGRRGRGTHSLSPSVHSHTLLTHTFGWPWGLMLTPAAECSTCCASQGSWPFSIRFSPTGVDTHKGDNRTTAPRGATPRTGRLSRRPRGNLRWCGSLDLLSTPLTIPLMGCQISSFRRVSSCGETMARRRKEERWAGTASPGM